MAIVTVDFDGTLYQGNSFKVMFQAGKKTFGLKQWGVVFTGMLKSLWLGLIRGKNALRLQFFKAFAKTFKGKTTEELEDFFQELVHIGKEEVNRGLVQTIKEHQRNGDTIILLSGALHPFLEAFAKELQLDVHIISTELKLDSSGLCTGEVGQIINGDEKVRQVEKWLEKAELNHTNEIWAYADSESDIPLLNYVEHPIVVNPNQDMKLIAKKNKWPIFAS
ncbi:HAD family hydrolase [Salinibacillus xinjiangensis]|uniref:HAD-IB family hydrolase n=1 Tax=Salinibacillus xinjiangensis TaxID=1229268 RepID=A0A6G1X5I9_9BACI|nr:HAD family hydrolase [Salinibacillus xinjiangensis]MRG86088.1 HAD-IB family hydrolase [Salinibacillus xinjiangensis]